MTDSIHRQRSCKAFSFLVLVAAARVHGLPPVARTAPSRLSHVVLAFHVKQLDVARINLQSWERVPPCARQLKHQKQNLRRRRLPTLTLYAASDGGAPIQTVLASLDSLWSSSNYKHCFAGATTRHLAIDNAIDNHVDGARLMFENMLAGNVVDKASVVLYMEPDLRPVRPNWLEAMERVSAAPCDPFWVKGSVFLGDAALMAATTYLPNMYHINGNALYNVGDKDFVDFYSNRVRPYVERKHGDSVNAYDTDMYEFLMDRANYDYARRVMRMYRYTGAIVNMWHTQYTIDDVLKANPDAVLVHGGGGPAVDDGR